MRIHTGSDANQQARSLGARAFTKGHDVVFGNGEYAPHTEKGRATLAHELTHVVQQTATEAASPAEAVRERTGSPRVSRLDASMCAGDCHVPDGTGPATGRFSLTIYADREGPFLLLPLTYKVGHSWLRLTDDAGRYWTYGFWPQEGFHADSPREDVAGCVHHPDTSHEPTASQTFELTAEEFAAAMNVAVTTCDTSPAYNLFGLQCTEFVKRVLQAAGKNTAGFGLIWESPNALDSWIRTHSLVLGASVTAAGSTPGLAGSFGFNATYTREFYSLLDHKLRLFGTVRTELGRGIQTLAPGVGLEVNPQIVWLPTVHSAALAPLGVLGGHVGLGEGGAPLEARFGAGVGGAAGLRYNIDEIGVVGVEYNVMKDLVNKDPTLHRLMLSVGVRFF